jgi:hypothetical protein
VLGKKAVRVVDTNVIFNRLNGAVGALCREQEWPEMAIYQGCDNF